MSDLLNSASLVMIPSGYAEDKVYSVVPSDGSGDLSFTRASNGTRVNSAGLVEVCPWNLVQYSEDFTNAVYAKYNSITATADQTTAPNGTTTADKIGLSTASTTFPNLAQDAQYIGGQVYTFSVYFKKNTVNFGKIRVGGTAFASSTNSPIFNLNTGVLVSGTGTIENVGNGWYRCSMTATADTSASGGFAIDLPDSTGVWSGASVYNVNDSIFAWGFMSNIGSTAKPYFPTTDRLNVPRLTYQNGGGGCPSLLLEKQSTNLLIRSEEFNTSWVVTSGSVTANQAISPDGTQNADLLVGEIYQQALQANSTTYSYSLYVKKDTGTTVYIGYIDNVTGFVGGSIVYTYSTGLISINQSANASVSGEAIPVGNGWIRLVMKFTTIASVTFNYQYIGSGGSYIYGAQLEASSYPTSYIVTTSSSATRVTDACYKTGISSLIGQSDGTMFVQCNLQDSTGAGQAIATLYENSSNVVILYKQSDNVLKCFVVTGGTLVADLGSIAVSGNIKIAVGYKANDFALYINGVQRGTDTSGSVPTCSNLYLGADDGGAQKMSGIISQAILFKTRLTNAELASLTTI